MEQQAATRTERSEYIVLARRYRPTRFEDVIGQQHVTRTLQNAIRAGRVHHAYLFTGSRGVGKTTVARILARALNHEGGPTAEPPPLTDPHDDPGSADVIEIDGASHTGVDNVRELRESVRYLPSRSRYKIYIIDEVHMLSTGAFNALLKTLEEPPPHVVFVFATTEPHKIPATILSRCQRFDFKRVPTGVLVEHMQGLLGQEGVAVDAAGLSLIARAAEGGVRDSLSLLDQVIAYASSDAEGEISATQVAEVLGVADRRVLFALSAAVLQHDAAAALNVVDELFRDGHDLSQVAQAFTAHLRDLVVVATCDHAAPLLDATEAELDELRKQSSQADTGLLTQHFDRFAHAAEEIARSSFPRLLFEIALVELVNAEPLLPLGDLLERLERLERGLASGAAGGAGGSSGGRGGAPKPQASKGPPRRAPLDFKTPGLDGGPKRRADGAPTPPQREPEPPRRGPEPPPIEHRGPEPPPIEHRGPEPPPIESASPAPPQTIEPSAPQQAPEPKAPLPEPTAESESAPTAPTRSAGGTALFASGDELSRWQRLLERVGAPLATTFAAGRLLGWKNGAVELGYASGAFEFSWAQDPKRRQTFAERCADVLGKPLEVRVRALTVDEERSPEATQLSAIEARERQREERVRRLREEAEGHPITRSLIDNFGAKILRVSVDND